MNWDPDSVADEQLEAYVRSVLDEELVQDTIGMVMTGWDLQDPDAALASLVFDSAVEAAVATGVRSSATDVRSRTYRVSGFTIDFEETEEKIIGQVVPVPTAVILETLRGAQESEVDAHGQFSIEVPGSGVARLRIQTHDQTVVTEWFLLGAKP